MHRWPEPALKSKKLPCFYRITALAYMIEEIKGGNSKIAALPALNLPCVNPCYIRDRALRAAFILNLRIFRINKISIKIFFYKIYRKRQNNLPYLP